MPKKFPCPCCGHLTLPSGPGDYEVCPVCDWEDDYVQLRWPADAGIGANGISLIRGQGNYAASGVAHPDSANRVRPHKDDEPLDPGWHRIGEDVALFEQVGSKNRRPRDLERLYWWRENYWRKPKRLDGPLGALGRSPVARLRP